MCIVCVRVSVCVCVRESKRALTSHYTAFQVKPAKPTPSWEAVCRSCSRFLLSASPIVSQQHCTLQSSSKCHLSRLWWLKATSYGMLSQMLMAPGFDSKSAYFFLSCICNASKSGFSNFHYKSFGDSQEKSEKLCLLFSSMTKSKTLRGYPYFRNALLIFMIFRVNTVEL